jgi:transcriptional regulator with XRE-family HTH domain
MLGLTQTRCGSIQCGMKLATYLEKHGLTEPEFAKAVGQSEFAVRKWLNGSRFPRRDNLLEIERVTGGKVTPNDFLSGAAA